MMTNAHHYHLDTILTQLNDLVVTKYQRGLSEHGGKLWEKRVMPEILNEVADLSVYIYTLKMQLDIIAVLAEMGANDESVVASEARASCRSILEIINGKHNK